MTYLLYPKVSTKEDRDTIVTEIIVVRIIIIIARIATSGDIRLK